MARNAMQRLINSVIQKVKDGCSITPADAQVLLATDPSSQTELFRAIVDASRAKKFSVFGGRVCPIVPIYVSSICQEHCLYCNYRAENKDKEIERLRLTDDELAQELHFLVDKGFRVIELVYATDPLISLADTARHIQITKEVLAEYGGGVVGINARPFSVADYELLKRAGLEFVVLWQETFDKERYRELHPGKTEKSDFDFRFHAHERMLDAGIRHIGLGVLSGLSDWRKDWLSLIERVYYLSYAYKGRLGNVILGIPRLKPAAGAEVKVTTTTPNSDELLLALSVFNLCFPKALPFVNTREPWDLCVQMARGGGTLFTFNCKTIPGGYALARRGYQFPTYDFDYEEYSSILQSQGLIPVSNWDYWQTERD